MTLLAQKRSTAGWHVRVLTLACALLVAAAPVRAGQTSARLDARVTVAPNCLVAAGSLDFGSYDPISANASGSLGGTADLSVTCTNGTNASIELSEGMTPDSGSSPTNPQRQMAGPDEEGLAYYLFKDPAHAEAWGGSSAARSFSGTGVTTRVTVYGLIPSGQVLQPGVYSDTIAATINF